MKKKIVLLTSGLLLASLGAVFGCGVGLASRALVEEAKSNAVSLAKVYIQAFDGNIASMSPADENVRETIIASDGTVLWDSKEDAAGMENHQNREEVMAALSGNPSTFVRSSSTLGVEAVYYAECKTVDAETYVVRVSYETSAATRFLSGYVPWMIVITLAAVGLGAFLSSWFVGNALRPLKEVEERLGRVAKGETPAPIVSSDPEISPSLSAIDDIAASLSRSMKALEEEKKNIATVLSSVSDGILAYRGETILFRNPAFDEVFPLMGSALSEDVRAIIEKQEVGFVKNGATYLCKYSENDTLSLFVFTNITEVADKEKKQQEFFDASSHELKTPLTAIRGFNELTLLQTQEENTRDCALRIQKETDRMLALVGDMLRLESLENAPTQTEEIHLGSLAREIVKELEPVASQKEISVGVDGDFVFPMKRDDAYSLLKNLMENAVHYGVEKGHVRVRFQKDGFVVEDDGIGIPKEYQARVFDRFFRVDKSRSRASGGTGLGLSIVKGIVERYGGKISLISKPGFGTTIAVSLPA